MSAVFRGAALIRGETLIRERRLFQCGYPKVRLTWLTYKLLIAPTVLIKSEFEFYIWYFLLINICHEPFLIS